MTALTLHELESGWSGYDTVTLGMGCFWGPDARFGALHGVLRTRTGYAGGTTPDPTYRNMGDHTEMVEVDYDPNIISHADILHHFWHNHKSDLPAYKGRQYISLLCVREDQTSSVEAVKAEVEAATGVSIKTEIVPFTGFTPAEIRHQKYFLKRHPGALSQIDSLLGDESELMDSTFAARLNGLVGGHIGRVALLAEISRWPLPLHARNELKTILSGLRW
ncbi:peptide-methionine (S)-S-oxide reductase MsrA [Salinicoccus siamensis]|uniref:peptide-methionine (S)-S-oxide reductase n=1 Tax=Salinicoccus siamensis TaxID=381830 RepID=A0ABV5Z5E6_9STAP